MIPALLLALGVQSGVAHAQFAHPWSIGHRGGTVLRPENTLPDYDFSLSNGVDGVEVDVWLSSDGVPVCHHDATVDRTTDGTGLVYLKTLAELKALDAGSWFAPEWTGTQIPTLEEALDVIAGRGKLFLDIKAISYVPAIVQTLQDYGFPEDDIWVWERAGTGAPFLALMPNAHGVTSINHTKDRELMAVRAINAGYDGIDDTYTRFDQDYVDEMHSYGMVVMSHTVVSPFFSEQIDMGVDIIVASHPTLLATLLPGPVPECVDGIDNDGDGLTDYPDDPGCFAPEDAQEFAACSDGVDNDGNGDTDYPADPGCFAAFSSTENPACSDGIDNNFDGDVDYPADAGCFALYDQAEQTSCNDGKDNDGDGLADFPADPDCLVAWSNDENGQCNDGLDNDGDGAVDFPADVDCGSPLDLWEASPPLVPALSLAGRGVVAGLIASAALILHGRRRSRRLPRSGRSRQFCSASSGCLRDRGKSNRT